MQSTTNLTARDDDRTYQQLPLFDPAADLHRETVYPSNAADGSAAVDNGRQTAPDAWPPTSHRSAMRRTGTWIIRVPQIGRTTLLGTCHLGSRVLTRPYQAARRQAYRLCTARARLQCSDRRDVNSSEPTGARPANNVVEQSANENRVSDTQPAELVTMAEVYDVAAHSRADSTRKKYGTQWQNFCDFYDPQGFPTLPAERDHIASFLVHLLKKGYSVSHIKGHASAIAARHVDQELPNPCSDPLITRVLSGIARILADVEKHQAPPLTEDIFDVIRDTACKRRRRGKGWETRAEAECRGIKDIALISIKREAMLRACDAARAKWVHLDRQADGSGRLRIPKGKTDQTGIGTVRYLSLEAMQDLDLLLEVEPQGEYIFSLTTRSIDRRIKAAARFAGFGEGFSSHSCRIGMAVDLTVRRFGLQSVQNAGGWKSPDMVAQYTAGAALADGTMAQYAEDRREDRKQRRRKRGRQPKQ